jgi:uncharacterized protein with PQ loop repeat
MDTIKTYLDNVFLAFPQNERTQKLKREMLIGMEERYLMLKREGKSEHEAVGSVIANFGSIDEIAAELGIMQNNAASEESLYLSDDEANTYISESKKAGIWIGRGVWLILTGVSIMLGVDSYAVFESEIKGSFGVMFMLLAIAVAVAIFIIYGMRLNKYESYKEQHIRLDQQTRARLEQQSVRFASQFVAHIVIGVMLVFIMVAQLIFFDNFDSLNGWPLMLFLFAIGFSVFLFITGGIIKVAYDIILGKGDYKHKKDKEHSKKGEKIIGTIAAVYWPVIVAGYLLWSFASNDWTKSWLIWPVAGVLFGAIAGGIGAWFNHD